MTDESTSPSKAEAEKTTPAKIVLDMQGVMKKTRSVRFYSAGRMRRESTLSSLVLVCGNLVILAISVLALVEPLSVSINAFVIVLSAAGLVASAYEWGAKPDLKRHRIYNAAKEMNQVLWQIDELFTKPSPPTLEEVEDFRIRYRELVGDADENHSTAEHTLVNSPPKGRLEYSWMWTQVNVVSIVYVLVLLALIGVGAFIYLGGRLPSSEVPKRADAQHVHPRKLAG